MESKYQDYFEALQHWAAETPDKICLIEAESEKSITYRLFWERILCFANRLKDDGLKNDDRVAVQVGQTINTLVAAFAIQIAGGIYVPVGARIGEFRIKEIIASVRAKVFISDRLIDFEGRQYDSGSFDSNQKTDLSLSLETNENRVRAILFTSGTSGKPKGVMISARNLCASAEIYCDFTGLNNSDVLLIPMPLEGVGGLRYSIAAFTKGAAVVLRNGMIFAKEAISDILKYGVTAIHLMPTHMGFLLRSENDFALFEKNIHYVVLVGESVRLDYQEKLRDLLPTSKLFIIYGSTEAGPLTRYEFSRYPITPFCIGTPHINVKLDIVDETGNKMLHSGIDNPGCIVCESSVVCRGYWNELEPNMINETGTPTKWTMQDMAYVSSEGLFLLLGRKDDIINIGGRKISALEVENEAVSFRDIRECACVRVWDKRTDGFLLKLYVVSNSGNQISKTELVDYLSKKLEAYKVPKIIEEIDALPRVLNLPKIDRKKLIGGI